MKHTKGSGAGKSTGPRNDVMGPAKLVPLHDVMPSPENDMLYEPINVDGAEFQNFAESVRKEGILEPIVATMDGYIISGHRRWAAARKLKLSHVPVRVVRIRRDGDFDKFMAFLRHYNHQRTKTVAERMREETVSAAVGPAWESLVEHREMAAETLGSSIDVSKAKRRPTISDVKIPFMKAVFNIVDKYRDCWPLSDRFIHYRLVSLPDPPPIGYAKSGRYRNNDASYKALTELLTRLRIVKSIPMEAIGDETRPVTILRAYREPGTFMREQIESLLKGYSRDLMQSQPNHVELVVEKNTVAGILKPVAMNFGIPMTSGRGYMSVPPRWEMAQRHRRSGKEKLILLIVGDFDPDGEQIAQSLAESMHRDFKVKEMVARKIALTQRQVIARKLQPNLLTVKEDAKARDKFIEAYGMNVFELEALEPEELRDVVRDEITGVIDVAAYNKEIDLERADVAALDDARAHIAEAVRGTLDKIGRSE